VTTRRRLAGVTVGLMLAVACASVGLAASAPAAAGSPFFKGFDENLFRSSDPQTRQRWFQESVEAGANIVRIGASWRHVVVRNRQPANPRDPADPAYDFSLIDAQVIEARRLGLEVLLTSNGAPRWAEGEGRPGWAPPGTWKPDPVAFGAFGEALARRYSGSFVTESGTLPQVPYYEAWNEPNQDEFLAPQWEHRQPFGPRHYRQMLNQFYAGVHAGNPAARVMGPGTSPFGDPGRTASRMRPLLFLREVLCLKGRKSLEDRGCSQPAQLDIVSHHPINFAGTHRDSALHPDDVTVPDMREVRRTVRAAQREGTLRPPGRKPMWVTELWWLTKPPSDAGVSAQQQATYLQGALYELWRQGVKAVLWYQLADDTEFPSGLFRSDGTPKPGLTAFRFPFVTRPAAGKRVTGWGIAPSSGQLSIERKVGSGWRPVKTLAVGDGVPFRTEFRLKGSAKLRATIGGEHSLPSKQRR
jgi:hypothetical protein